MPNIEHSLLSTGELHEPKGVTSAAVGQFYRADGAGSGAWVTPVLQGWEDYNHGGGSQSLTNGVRSPLLNDGAGANTNTAHKLPGTTGIWDAVTNRFNWAAGGCQVGDTVDLRIDVTVTVDTNNDGFLIDLTMAEGGATPFQLLIDERNIDLAGSQNIVRFASLYIGSEDVLNNPAYFGITPNSSGDTVQVKGWYVRVTPKEMRFV